MKNIPDKRNRLSVFPLLLPSISLHPPGNGDRLGPQQHVGCRFHRHGRCYFVSSTQMRVRPKERADSWPRCKVIRCIQPSNVHLLYAVSPRLDRLPGLCESHLLLCVWARPDLRTSGCRPMVRALSSQLGDKDLNRTTCTGCSTLST